MHMENRLFWERCVEKYARHFNDPSRAVEFGSLNINGSIREYCRCTDYTGLDWKPGPCVDIVSLAHEAPFAPESFDTVVSASMLEHDPFWDKSIRKMVEVLKPDGILILSWGAMKNVPHCLATAPDGKFHALKPTLVLNLLEAIGVYVHEFQYERSILEAAKGSINNKQRGLGEVALVAFKDRAYATGKSIHEAFQPEDEIGA